MWSFIKQSWWSPENKPDSRRASDPEVIHPATSCISPEEKPIQMSVVQSSTGASPILDSQSSMKESQCDQAPACRDNEEESKNTNVLPTIPEESNIKILIQQFEDILKPVTDKTNESSSSKPGQVEFIVRKSFTKLENCQKILFDSEKVDVLSSKFEEYDNKTIYKSTETQEGVTRSSYDSPSDEPKILSDSAYASLEQLPSDNDRKERESTVEEMLRKKEEEDDDFVFVSNADVEGYNEDIASVSQAKYNSEEMSVEIFW